MARRVLALFAKAPVPGAAKTRLSPPLTPERAAGLYEAMLLDVLDQHARAPDCELALWFTPDDAEPWFAAHAPSRYRRVAQRGASLAERMRESFRTHAAEGFERMVLRGTDSPTLPLARVEAAFAALDHSPVVLCPDRDGGYNLIGQSTPNDALFELELSRASVLAATLARARELGLACELLPAHHDVDTWQDVLQLASELDPAHTPRTLARHRELLAR
ncbi:MAG TPA: TIGR04282 family arsenosugar biosynthesis glycosyltransferase [Myxococcota bacterium]|nr:TIGR04282 family arsenosugar biosynthesis glycosyltransferase [Myxococcota bacterium]